MTLFRRQIILILAVSCLIAACKRTPSPPTEDDAIAVWKNIHNRPPRLDELLSLKKTNGQMAEVNGVKVYTLYYTATKRYLTQVGSTPPGTVETKASNYAFQWTEKGWVGPDQRVYPEH